MYVISHDAFARTSLGRTSVKPNGKTCSNCGGVSARGLLFQYATIRDGVSKSYVGPHTHNGLFCSKSCHDAYHGG